MKNFSSINNYFSQQLAELNCDEDVKNYIIGIFSKYKSSEYDLSKDSITLKYSEAKLSNNFEKFQTIADWLFYANALFPEVLKNASREYYCSLGQLSYFSCYKIIRQWKIYELLSDDFIVLSTTSGKIILNKI